MFYQRGPTVARISISVEGRSLNTRYAREEEHVRSERSKDTKREPGSGISRRDFLKVGGAGLAGVTVLGAAGCGGGNQGGSSGGGGTAGGGPKKGTNSQLIIGYDQEPNILNNYVTGGDLQATQDTTVGILQSPLKIMPDLSFAPELADGMPKILKKDPLTIEYKLKDGLTWSDGKPLTSEDARWTFEQVMNKKNHIITRFGWDKISKFETPDKRTVRMTFKEPFAPWMTLLGGSETQILPKHIYQNKDFNTALNNSIVGSGPYKFDTWKKGEYLSWVRNDNYWGNKPAIEKVTFRWIPDTNTLINSLRNGEVQFINPPVDIGLLQKLKSISGTKVQSKAGTVWEHIAFNLDKVPNLDLRRAIAYGINRKQVIDKLLKGQVKPLQSVLVPDQKPYYTPAWQEYTHDPAKAKQYAQKAKSAGANMNITFSTTADNTLRETLQQIVQQQLKEYGINISIKNTAAETFFGQWTPKGNFEMGEWAWLASPDPSITTLFSADQIPPNGQNYYRYKNQQVTKWLHESDKTVDVNQRAALLKKAQDQMAKDLPLIPMYQRPVYIAYVDNLQGPQVNPTLAGVFWNIGEWKFV